MQSRVNFKEMKIMGYRNSNTITVETAVEVSIDDIRDQMDFDDMVAAYEPDSDDLLKHVDFEDALKFVTEHAEYSQEATIESLLEDHDLKVKLIERLSEDLKIELPEVKVTEGALFKSVTVGLLAAVIVGTKVRFKHADHDEVHEFTCADSGMALNLLQGLSMVQS